MELDYTFCQEITGKYFFKAKSLNKITFQIGKLKGHEIFFINKNCSNVSDEVLVKIERNKLLHYCISSFSFSSFSFLRVCFVSILSLYLYISKNSRFDVLLF